MKNYKNKETSIPNEINLSYLQGPPSFLRTLGSWVYMRINWIHSEIRCVAVSCAGIRYSCTFQTRGYWARITCVCLLSCVKLCATPQTVACQTPQSTEFSRQELEQAAISSSRVIFLTHGSNPPLLSFLHWQSDSLPLGHRGSLLEYG